MQKSLLHENMDWSLDFEFMGDDRAIYNYESSAETVELLLKKIANALDYCYEELRETEQAFALVERYSESEEDLVDGFCDLAVVAFNGIYKTFRYFGCNHDEAKEKSIESFRRVIEANNSKRQEDGSVLYNSKGKVVKPDTFAPPRFGDLIV